MIQYFPFTVEEIKAYLVDVIAGNKYLNSLN